MGRMLEALKTLESRRQPGSAAPQDETPSWPEAYEPQPVVEQVLAELAPEPEASPSRACLLPSVPVVGDHYLRLSERISDQLPGGGSVLMFVGCDYRCGACFSMVELAQAFASRSSANVLLVDGELRAGRLSRSVGVMSPGMTEIMLGTAGWSAAIRQTLVPGVDLVPSGSSEVPAFERPDFGWNELRECYRAVLIGLNDVQDAETPWLAARCDATYLVVSRPHTPRQTACDALARLRAAGANVLGCIATGD
jgi:Mrp family chromosome partitioning ATPase